MLAVMLVGCSANSPPITLPPALSFGARQNLTSFLGVRFGDSLYHVQTRFPAGFMRTGPSGQDAYRIDNIEVDNIRYQQVEYEFTTLSGMQMVQAWFTPESGAAVYSKLVQAVGEPNRKTPGAAQNGESYWNLPHEQRAIFDGPKRFVAVLGPGGNPLKHDFPASTSN
jgi:hypothetical protein